jgi:hypothetical protein
LTEQAALDAVIGALPSVQLNRLQSDAALFSRRERKYLVPVSAAASLVATISEVASALQINNERSFRYESVYFDTPAGQSYFASARRRRHAFKVRTRTYVNSGDCMLEVKLRGSRGQTTKSRLAYPANASGQLDGSAREFIAEVLGAGHESALAPTLTTLYRRSTLLLPGDARLTIDTGFSATTPAGERITLNGFAIIETKSRQAPTVADRTLWRMGFRPIKLSKFGTSLAAMDPTLPSNRWTRALKSPWTRRGVRASASA